MFSCTGTPPLNNTRNNNSNNGGNKWVASRGASQEGRRSRGPDRTAGFLVARAGGQLREPYGRSGAFPTEVTRHSTSTTNYNLWFSLLPRIKYFHCLLLRDFLQHSFFIFKIFFFSLAKLNATNTLSWTITL